MPYTIDYFVHSAILYPMCAPLILFLDYVNIVSFSMSNGLVDLEKRRVCRLSTFYKQRVKRNSLLKLNTWTVIEET